MGDGDGDLEEGWMVATKPIFTADNQIIPIF